MIFLLLDKDEKELTPAEFRSEEIEKAFREACHHYKHEFYPGRVDLFRPPLVGRYEFKDGRILSESRIFLDYKNHWSPYIENIEVHVVTGDHDSMVLEPHVRVLSDRLRKCLEEAHERSITSEIKVPNVAAE